MKMIERSLTKEHQLKRSPQHSEFNAYRFKSITRPNVIVGMLFQPFGSTEVKFSRRFLENLDLDTINAHIDKTLEHERSELRGDEEFVLQGGIDGGNWMNVKFIDPIPGAEPSYHGESHITCDDCQRLLSDEEFAKGDRCTQCEGLAIASNNAHVEMRR